MSAWVSDDHTAFEIILKKPDASTSLCAPLFSHSLFLGPVSRPALGGLALLGMALSLSVPLCPFHSAAAPGHLGALSVPP